MPEGHIAILRDHSTTEKWADRNLIKLNREKCKVLNLESKSLLHQYSAGKQLDRKGPEIPGACQVEHETAMCPCGKEGERWAGLHWAKYG